MRNLGYWIAVVFVAFAFVRFQGDAATAFVDDVPISESDVSIERHHEFDCIADSGDPGPAPLRRLTLTEFINTVQSVFGIDITADAERYFPRDIRADGFSNTAYNLTVDLGHIQAYARLADIVVGQIDVVAFVDEFASARELTDESMRELINCMGTWVLRGPLNEHEVETYLTISRAVAEEEGEFRDAVGYVLRGMLQSPRFLYLIENRQGDGSSRLLGDYELAARMSYILWGAPPDRELMQAAENGELIDEGNVRKQIERMLQDPRAIERSRQFITEWLDLDRLSSLRPNPERFPTWNDQLAADMREETLAYFTDLAWQQDQPLTELMHAQFTYATPRLAAHYGLPWNESLGYATSDTVQGPQRNTEGLLVLYTFHERDGETIHDVSEAGEPLHLQIPDRDAVQWTDAGLQITSPTWISTATSAAELVDAIKSTQEFSLEAWVTPANTEQTGPARIVTLSTTTSYRNFTLGQDAALYEFRCRTTNRGTNGSPGLRSNPYSATLLPTHVVYSRAAGGLAKIYVNGELQGTEQVSGDLSNWDSSFSFGLANEATGDRPWLGTFHLVAVFNRVLSEDEIQSTGGSVSRYDLSSIPERGGLLTQGSVLTVGGDNASMVTRGLFVLHDVLASGVSDPPPCVDTTPVPTEPGLSHREIAEQRMADHSCGGCHAHFEPLAFGLEVFDGVGAFGERDEHGNQLRSDGEILFPEADEAIRYENTRQLLDLLGESERVRQCLTMKVTQFAIGRPLVQSDVCSLSEIHQSAYNAGGTYADLMTAVIMSDLVRKTRTETSP